MRAAIKTHGVFVSLLTLAALITYLPSLGHEFLSNWDDNSYVTANEAVRGFTVSHLKLAFSRTYVGNYAPVQIISYMLDHAVWGMVAHGFILTNVLIHTINSLLYYGLVIRITSGRLLAFVSAALFLLHPVQVESVVWISQRKNLLAIFFCLIAMHCYLDYRRDGSARMYWLSLAAFVLALLSKSVAVVLPAVLFLYDICFLPEERRNRWIADKVPFLAAAGLVAFGAIVSQTQGYQGVQGGRVDWHGGSPLNTVYTMLPVFFSYLRLLVWPTGLSAVYMPVIRTAPDIAVLAAAAGILVLCALGFRLYRRNPGLFFCGGVFLLGLLPVSQIVPLITLMNDRYLYLPLLGVAPFAAAAVTHATGTANGGRRLSVLALVAAALLALAAASYSRAKAWENSATLWQDAVIKSPVSDIAWTGLADARRVLNDLKGARDAYSRALEINPKQEKALHGLGYVSLQLGEPLLARPYLKKTTELYPQLASGFQHLGHSYYMTGEYVAAEAAYRQALAIQPRLPEALLHLGNIYLSKRDLRMAATALEGAVSAGGNSSALDYSMACLAALQGDASRSLLLLDRAMRQGYSGCEAVRANEELESIRRTPGYGQLMAEFCASGGGR